jgi:hypothetical protein
MPQNPRIVGMYTHGWITKNVPVIGVHHLPCSSAGSP